MIQNNASLFRRLLGRILDFHILTLVIAVLFFAVNGSFSIAWRDSVTWDIIYTIYLIAIPIVWSGYVVGKRICKTKMKRMDDNEVKLSNTFLREVVGFQIIGFLTLGLAFIISSFMIAFREDKRAIHDIIGGTYVRTSN
ncbi:RDD family protein [Salibacterium salarium]|uniref:RDD family protein n=1 Tax=Salibacterium salarium TaxID=284579 RepID=A0A3R9QWX2_9BACI|nr:RDD family protein [Salibacterium salarium]RSL35183.1 RDD family protein [Salibacterium salarium]